MSATAGLTVTAIWDHTTHTYRPVDPRSAQARAIATHIAAQPAAITRRTHG